MSDRQMTDRPGAHSYTGNTTEYATSAYNPATQPKRPDISPVTSFRR